MTDAPCADFGAHVEDIPEAEPEAPQTDPREEERQRLEALCFRLRGGASFEDQAEAADAIEELYGRWLTLYARAEIASAALEGGMDHLLAGHEETEEQ